MADHHRGRPIGIIGISFVIMMVLVVSPWILRSSDGQVNNIINKHDVYIREFIGDKFRPTNTMKIDIYNKSLQKMYLISDRNQSSSTTTSKTGMDGINLFSLGIISVIPMSRKRKNDYERKDDYELDEAYEIIGNIIDYLDQPCVFQILMALEPEAKTFKELLEETKIPRSTLDKYLKTLYFDGFVDKIGEYRAKYIWSELLRDFFSLMDDYRSNNPTESINHVS